MPRPPAALPGWLVAELDPTLRLAVALTGSPITAVDLVAESLARDPGWTGLAPTGDPSPLLRAALLRTHLRDPPAPVPGADGLAALSPVARAAVVLRDGERLTTAEIATLLDRPVRQVGLDLAHGLDSFDAEIAALRAAAPARRQVADRYPAAVQQVGRERGRRHRLIGAGVLAGVLVVAGAVLLPTVVVRLLPPEVREPGEWRFSHRIELADGWAIEQRLLTRRTEQTVIRLPITNGDPGSCTVILADEQEPISPRAETHPVRVRGRDATYVDDPELDPSVVWSYAEGRFAQVSCSRLVTPEAQQLQVAEAVVFRGERVRLPFTLDARPEGFRVEFVSRGATEAADVVVGLVADDAAAPSVAITYGSDELADRCLDQDRAVRSAGTVGQREGEVCLTATTTTDDPSGTESAPGRAVDTVTGHVRPAEDLADPQTWFDATNLPD